MSSRWENPERVTQLAEDMADMALQVKLGAWEPIGDQPYQLLIPAVELAAGLAKLTGIADE